MTRKRSPVTPGAELIAKNLSLFVLTHYAVAVLLVSRFLIAGTPSSFSSKWYLAILLSMTAAVATGMIFSTAWPRRLSTAFGISQGVSDVFIILQAVVVFITIRSVLRLSGKESNPSLVLFAFAIVVLWTMSFLGCRRLMQRNRFKEGLLATPVSV